MTLPSCRTLQTGLVQAMTAVLGGANAWEDPSVEHKAAIDQLASQGFLSVKEDYFIKCACPSDKDWLYVTDVGCPNKISLPFDFNEVCDDLYCDVCGRILLPLTYQKQQFVVLTVQPHYDTLQRWFEAQLDDCKVTWQKTAAGVYQVFCHSHLVILVLPEFCQDLRYLTMDYLKTQLTALVTLRHRVSYLPVQIPTLHMAELISARKCINGLLQCTMAQGLPTLLPNTGVPLFPLSAIPLVLPERKLSLRPTKQAVYLNDVEIVSSQATTRRHIFKVLLDQFYRDCESELPHDAHTYITIQELTKRLEPYLGYINSIEDQVRGPLNKLRQHIQKVLFKPLGIMLDNDAVIESEGWAGYTQKDHGYRLNPTLIVIFRK